MAKSNWNVFPFHVFYPVSESTLSVVQLRAENILFNVIRIEHHINLI